MLGLKKKLKGISSVPSFYGAAKAHQAIPTREVGPPRRKLVKKFIAENFDPRIV